MAYIGNNPDAIQNTIEITRFNGTGACTQFTIPQDVDDAKAIEVLVNSVQQDPDNSYTVTNGLITFSEAPSVGTNNVTVLRRTGLTYTRTQIDSADILPNAVTTVAIADGSITSSKLSSTLSISGNFLANNVTANTNFITAAGSVGAPAIFPSGDTNTGIFFPAADTIAFTEGGVESMRIDAAGQVGVGVTPNTWSTGKAVEVGGSGGALWGLASGTVYSTAGYYFNSTDKFAITGNYAMFSQLVSSDGSFRWSSSTATGTAGNNATMSERMRIDSSGAVMIGGTTTASATGYTFVNALGSNGGSFETYSGTARQANFFSDSGSAYFGSVANIPLIIRTNNTERMRIDSSGSLLVGQTTAAVETGSIVTAKNLEITRTVDSDGAALGQLSWVNNTNAGSGSGSSFVKDVACIKGIMDGTGNNSGGYITFETKADAGSRAERMRITSGGDLLVGDTATSAFFDGRVSSFSATFPGFSGKTSGGAAMPAITAWNTATSGDNFFLQFATEASATGRGSITYNRAGGLTAYNTTSDYRSKDIISNTINSGEVIDSVPVYMGKMKGATQARPMFIAHETPDYAHTGEKDAVDKDGNPVYQQMDASSLVPVLWAEVQSLRKRLALLESN
jgi:hypothetical protein